MIPINAKQAATPASYRSVVLSKERSLTVRVSLAPAAIEREVRDLQPARYRRRTDAGAARKAAAASSRETGGTALPAAGIAKDGTGRGRRRSGRRWRRKAGRTVAAAVMAAAAAAARDASTEPAAAKADAAAASPPLDDLLCEMRDLAL